jgi:DHA1 family bicyclomycin/chloramphenicol resistance-like MFS transporter
MAYVKRGSPLIILLLGALSTVSPLSIDMYLPAFSSMAAAFGTTAARVSLSISSYFVGLSLGQLIYGPLLDRFGRKPPVYFGLSLFVLASIGCTQASSVEMLIFLRFVQALGGCAAQVGAMSMIRDFFPPEDIGKILSMLMLVLGVSPLLAPTAGGFIAGAFGWQGVFVTLAGLMALVLAAIYFFLPESHAPDPTIELGILPVLREFGAIVRDPQFTTYTFAGAFSFSGLFVYVAGSPIIFMEVFRVAPKTYGMIFALLSVGFIGASQLNILLSRKFSGAAIFRTALYAQVAIGVVFAFGAVLGWYGLASTVALLFASLACAGLTGPNSAGLALAPFSRNAGSASALLGVFQMGIGALASASVGLLNAQGLVPVAFSLLGAGAAGCAILLVGRRYIARPVAADPALSVVH